MKKLTYKLIFNRIKEKGRGPFILQIRVYYRRRYIYKSTGIRLYTNQWDPGRWVINHPRAAELNISIRKQMRNLEDIEFDMLRHDIPVNLDKLAGKSDKVDSRHDFINYMRQTIEGGSIRSTTKRQHRSALNCLVEYGKIITFGSLTYDNIVLYDRWLREKGLRQASIHAHHKRLKTYINKAIVADLLPVQNNPYLKFKPSVGSVPARRYLTAPELEKIENVRLNIERLNQVRHLFLFSCYTGLAYFDMAGLTVSNLRTDAEGDRWITIIRHKTNEQVTIPLIKKAVQILEDYNGSLPVISNQNINTYLKEIATLADLKTRLTFHMARHTFATTVTLARGVPLWHVSKMLGHASIRTTQIYSKIMDQDVKESMKKIN
jgi:site-specific recombinase XerD